LYNQELGFDLQRMKTLFIWVLLGNQLLM
jgi:hypothetical protein